MGFSWWQLTTIGLPCCFSPCPPKGLVGVAVTNSLQQLLPLQNTPLSFEKGITQKTRTVLTHGSCLSYKEHREALGCVALQAAHSSTGTCWARKWACAVAAPQPVAQAAVAHWQPAISRHRLQDKSYQSCGHLGPYLCESLGWSVLPCYQW